MTPTGWKTNMSAKIEIENLLRQEPYFSEEADSITEPKESAVKSRVGLAFAEIAPLFSTTTARDVPEESSSVKKTISVEEITADLQRGVPDAELMKKYGLSEDGLRRLFHKLLKAMCSGSRHIEMESEE